MNRKHFKLVRLQLIVFMCFFTAGSLFSQSDTSNKKTKDELKDKTEETTDTYTKLIEKSRYSSGMFSVIQDKTDVYFEIPDSLFQREFLIVNKLSQVPKEINEAGANKGMNYENKLISFQKDSLANKVWVKTQSPRIFSPKEDAITESVRNNFAESILEFFDIAFYNEDSTAVVVKVNKVFDGKQKSFNDVLSGLGIPTSIKTDLSFIESVKSFPENIVVKSQLTTSVNEGGGDMPITFGVTSNIVLLSETPMRPRIADKRVGYFTEKSWHFNDAQHAMEEQEIITKWNLEPREEDIELYLQGKLVVPKKPIVYYIDPATPPQWREHIKAGVEDWQKAFEKAGFKDAILAKDAPEDDDDFDIDDVRYSVITYVASPRANAMGPAVIDPRSGEIIESDIIWWHNVMTSLHSWMRIQTGPIDPKARANKFDDSHMGEAIRFVSSHEVGHTFGLKHNMGASYAYPVDSLRSKQFTDSMGGTSPSIMDYARYNYVAQPEDGVTSITPKIGVYDTYAIDWGYRWYPSQEIEEKELLKMLEAHQDDPRFFYGEQQDYLNIIDPRSQSEDLGDDAVLASEYGLKNLQRVIDNLLEWTAEDGVDYYEAGKLYIGAIGQWHTYNKHVLSSLGGVYLDHVFHNNGKKAYEAVPYEKQERAMNYLKENAFKIPDWLFFNEILEKTYALKDSPIGPFEYSAYTLARQLQYGLIYELLMDERLLRLIEAELYHNYTQEEAPYTIANLLDESFDAIFVDLKNPRKLSILERMTQKNYVDALIISTQKLFEKTNKKALQVDLNLNMPALCSIQELSDRQLRNINYSSMKRVSEVTSYKKASLLKIRKRIHSYKKSRDAATQAHYVDLINRIDDVLNL